MINRSSDRDAVYRLLRAYRLSAAQITGSPESFKRLRSRVQAAMDTLGP